MKRTHLSRHIGNVVATMAACIAFLVAPAHAQFASCSSGPAGSLCLSSGDVGIGTTSPAYSLELGSGSQVFPTPGGTVVFGAHGSAVFGTGNATTLIDSVSNSGALYMNSGNGTPAFSVSRSSNITVNDYTIFSMRNLVFAPGSLWNSIFSVGNVGIGGAFSAGNGTSPTPPSSLSVAGGVSVGSYATSTTNAGTGNLSVSGNVGVGTQSPGYKVDVQGGQINASGGLCISSVCQTAWPTIPSSPWTAGGGGIYYSSGDVGIGTSAPTSALDVNGPITIEQKNFGGPAGLLIKGLSTGLNWPNLGFSVQDSAGLDVIGASVSGQITNTTHGSEAMDWFLSTMNGGSLQERLRVTASGNVGIGTTSPVHPLQVAGTIGAEEVIVSSTGADYVFAPGYKLAPLSEVAAYVKENHHLPDIPSAAEVKEKGVSLGDMQAKLLAKVEELTLHMIESDKENRELRERIVQLESGRKTKLRH